MKRLLLSVAMGLPVFNAQVSAASPPKPPVGVPSDAVHLNGKWYRVYLETVTWRQARDRCRKHGGQLAVVHDEPTWTFVSELSKGQNLWLGATDEKTEGRWVWSDGKELQYEKWGENEPNGHKKENYLALGSKGTVWLDAPDNWPWCVGYMCEWKK